MNLRNNIILIGNLGNDPEYFQLESGRQLAKFSLATSEYYRNQKGDLVTSTQWHHCVGWGKTAEMIKDRLRKGGQIALQGKVVYNSYEDKSGVKRYMTQIVISSFMQLGKREE